MNVRRRLVETDKYSQTLPHNLQAAMVSGSLYFQKYEPSRVILMMQITIKLTHQPAFNNSPQD
jgi:hypothetical protein